MAGPFFLRPRRYGGTFNLRTDNARLPPVKAAPAAEEWAAFFAPLLAGRSWWDVLGYDRCKGHGTVEFADLKIESSLSDAICLSDYEMELVPCHPIARNQWAR